MNKKQGEKINHPEASLKDEPQGLDRHGIKELCIIINACIEGGNKKLQKEAEEALKKKTLQK